MLQRTIFTRILIKNKANNVLLRPMTSKVSKTLPVSNALKLRPVRQNLKKKSSVGLDSWSVVGYSTADRYNLFSLTERLSTQVSTFKFTDPNFRVLQKLDYLHIYFFYFWLNTSQIKYRKCYAFFRAYIIKYNYQTIWKAIVFVSNHLMKNQA